MKRIQKFKQLLRKGVFSDQVTAERLVFREFLVDLILNNYTEALEVEAESCLWKFVHYKFIEEFRVLLKKLVQKCKSQGLRGLDERFELKSVSSKFRLFLTESIGFYMQFIQRFVSKNGLDLDFGFLDMKRGVGVSTEPRADRTQLLLTVYYCLVCLGDLARYREGHADKKSGHWEFSKMFYTTALELLPDRGNAYNQLAVIETYQNNEFAALEMLFRSLAVKHAFSIAMENLQATFKKKRQQLQSGAVKDAMDVFQCSFIALLGSFISHGTYLD
jgi:tetratricopeptide (TPR) repeat protein